MRSLCSSQRHKVWRRLSPTFSFCTEVSLPALPGSCSVDVWWGCAAHPACSAGACRDSGKSLLPIAKRVIRSPPKNFLTIRTFDSQIEGLTPKLHPKFANPKSSAREDHTTATKCSEFQNNSGSKSSTNAMRLSPKMWSPFQQSNNFSPALSQNFRPRFQAQGLCHRQELFSQWESAGVPSLRILGKCLVWPSKVHGRATQSVLLAETQRERSIPLQDAQATAIGKLEFNGIREQLPCRLILVLRSPMDHPKSWQIMRSHGPDSFGPNLLVLLS